MNQKMKSPIRVPNVLLPASHLNMKKWAVIACDQFTSQPEYWEQLETFINGEPSTLQMILPEVYLEQATDDMIESINNTMQKYLDDNQLRPVGQGMILVNRKTKEHERRLGLIMNIDLEAYSYEEGSQPLIRTTEKTIIERIPPRARIRKDAPLELTHVMLLMDDKKQHIIEKLYQKRNGFNKLYDFDLNMDGGHITGYHVVDTDEVIDAFMKLIEDDQNPILFVAGDGNHSLATAKEHWNELKKNLQPEEIDIHPARFAMVEVVNLYDEGLEFEGIHRILFNVKDDFFDQLQEHIDKEVTSFGYSKKHKKFPFYISKNAPLAYEQVQMFIDAYLEKNKDVKIDYVHGEQEVIDICNKYDDAIGLIMPTIQKESLFPFIKQGKVLQRKSFSMGCAQSKRYYLESQRIIFEKKKGES